MKVAVFGLGYVGLTAAGCLVRQGHHVVGFDPSEVKCKQINTGKSPIFEPDLDDLLALGLREGRLSAAPRPGLELDDCDLAIVCVGTPSLASGAHNMTYIAEVAREIGQLTRRRTRPLTVAFRSTLRPGTMDDLVAPFLSGRDGAANPAVELVYNPEFLRESSAILDYFHPPKIVVGTKDGKTSQLMTALYEGIDAPTFVTRFREAELTKFVDNSFHALKVAFANEIGRVCVHLGISAKTIHEIFIADTKLNISPRYFRPGGAFGGSCLPKDVRALSHMAAEIGADSPVIDALLGSNEAHKRFLVEHASRDLPPRAKVLLVGLAFKSNSDDLRESPNVDIARRLLQQGYRLSIYDPVIDPSTMVGANLGYAYSQLPTIDRLLITRTQAEAEDFDLVIDANGGAAELDLRTARLFDAHALP
jgi:GDP-mannose 6-dehydrogenase